MSGTSKNNVKDIKMIAWPIIHVYSPVCKLLFHLNFIICNNLGKKISMLEQHLQTRKHCFHGKEASLKAWFWLIVDVIWAGYDSEFSTSNTDFTQQMKFAERCLNHCCVHNIPNLWSNIIHEDFPVSTISLVQFVQSTIATVHTVTYYEHRTSYFWNVKEIKSISRSPWLRSNIVIISLYIVN